MDEAAAARIAGADLAGASPERSIAGERPPTVAFA
jgi:hypothetical protein